MDVIESVPQVSECSTNEPFRTVPETKTEEVKMRIRKRIQFDTPQRHMNRTWHSMAAVLAAVVLLFALSATGFADETAESAPPPTWSGSAGLSYLATTGNSDTKTLGFDFDLKKIPDPWGLQLTASYLRNSDSGETTAERYGAVLRGDRKLSERWSIFLSGGAGRDRFAGFDFRGVLAGGGNYKVLLGPTFLLDFDLGLTWTKEKRIAAEDLDYLGGIAGLNFAWIPRKDVSLTQKIKYFPNFDDASNWRIFSETAFQSAVAGPISIKLSYEVRYQNKPVPGFKETDTTAKAALVVSF